MQSQLGRGFSLFEVLTVIVIISILVALALPSFTKTKEAAFDREAKISLKLIQAAEKIYFLKATSYYPPGGGPADVASINADLGLDLTDTNWVYGITSAGVAAFTATARRNTRQWRITAANDAY